jgi:hypothetical protein
MYLYVVAALASRPITSGFLRSVSVHRCCEHFGCITYRVTYCRSTILKSTNCMYITLLCSFVLGMVYSLYSLGKTSAPYKRQW